MRFAGVFFLFLTILLACSSKQEPPPDVLPREKLLAVMVDFQMVEAAVQSAKSQGEAGQTARQYYDMVLEKHQISREQFRRSIQWYQDHMAAMDSLYSDLIDSLSGLQSRAGFRED